MFNNFHFLTERCAQQVIWLFDSDVLVVLYAAYVVQLLLSSGFDWGQKSVVKRTQDSGLEVKIITYSLLFLVEFYCVEVYSQHEILTIVSNQIFIKTIWQIGVLEDTRNRTLHGILCVQSCFRGHLARCHIKELKKGISTLQSCINLPHQHRTNHLLVLGIQI